SSTEPAPPAISTLSLHDALPILILAAVAAAAAFAVLPAAAPAADHGPCLVGAGGGERCTLWYGRVVHVDDGDTLTVKVGSRTQRSEEHTSELQSRENLVCRLLLE